MGLDNHADPEDNCCAQDREGGRPKACVFRNKAVSERAERFCLQSIGSTIIARPCLFPASAGQGYFLAAPVRLRRPNRQASLFCRVSMRQAVKPSQHDGCNQDGCDAGNLDRGPGSPNSYCQGADRFNTAFSERRQRWTSGRSFQQGQVTYRVNRPRALRQGYSRTNRASCSPGTAVRIWRPRTR